MAGALSQHLFFIHSLHHNHHCFCYSTLPPSKFSTIVQNPKCSVRIRTVPKSTPRKSPSTSIEPSSQNPKPPIIPHQLVESPDPSSISGSSQFNSFSRFICRFREGIKFDELGMDIVAIALPAALALAADPIASLVDTAFVGHLGSVELAAVGVSVSVFNLVSKLFNVPLLNITTSFVAEEQALVTKDDGENIRTGQDYVADQQRKKLLPSVSTSLALAAGIGIAEAVALFVGSDFLMNTMGIPVDSPMHLPAQQFLALRAFGAPPIVIALAAQGTFRGFKDTKTPLYAVGKYYSLIHNHDFLYIAPVIIAMHYPD